MSMHTDKLTITTITDDNVNIRVMPASAMKYALVCLDPFQASATGFDTLAYVGFLISLEDYARSVPFEHARRGP